MGSRIERSRGVLFAVEAAILIAISFHRLR